MDSAEHAIEKNIQVNGEHYIGNSLNKLIKEGKNVVLFDVDQWISFSDPFELDVYYFWDDFFHTRYSPLKEFDELAIS